MKTEQVKVQVFVQTYKVGEIRKKVSEKVVFSGFQNAYQVKGVFVQRYKLSTF